MYTLTGADYMKLTNDEKALHRLARSTIQQARRKQRPTFESVRRGIAGHFHEYVERPNGSFAGLHSPAAERALKIWTVVSLLAICSILAYEAQNIRDLSLQQKTLFDKVILCLVVVEVAIRTMKLEYYPTIAHAQSTSLRTTSETPGDTVRFAYLKVVLYWVDIVIVLSLILFVSGVRISDPLYLSMARLLRLVAILRAFDLPIMRDLTTVILSAFESMGLVIVALGMHLFVYSVIGTVCFGSSCSSYFGDLLTSMNTLLYPLINGGESPAAKQLSAEARGQSIGPILYFSSFLWIGGVILIGVLTRLAKEKIEMLRRT